MPNRSVVAFVVLGLAACGSDRPRAPATLELVALGVDLVGGTAKLHVTVVDNGFAGAVDVALDGPPTGLTADPLMLPQGTFEGDLVLHAPAGTFFDQAVTVEATSGSQTGSATAWVSAGFDTGSLDPDFGDNGIATVQIHWSCGALAFQPDGKIVIGLDGGSAHAGAIVRLTENGQLDPSFGTNGEVDFPGNNGGPGQVLVDSDGSIFAVGQQQHISILETRIWKVGADGVLDASFGGGGFVAPVPAYYELSVVAGNHFLIGSLYGGSPFFARLEPDGTLDPTLGNAGLVSFSHPGTPVPLPDGSGWLIAGSSGSFSDGSLRGYLGLLVIDGSERPQIPASGPGMSQYEFPVVGTDAVYVVFDELTMLPLASTAQIQRLRPDLSTDPTFAAEGVVGRPLAIQPDGKLIVYDTSLIGHDHFLRLNPDGSLDPAVRVSAEGLAQGRLPDKPERSCGPAVDAAGRLVIGFQPNARPVSGLPNLSLLRIRL